VRLKTTKITEKARNLENMNRFRARQVQSPEEIFNNISQLGIQREYIEVALRNVEVPDENQVLNWIDNHRE
jgi:SOS response regulatory protein OraA/RecX